jgi:mono/diheme cytochrome c family protein
MIKPLSALLLTLSIVLVLSACGSDKTAESSANNPTNSPLVEASASPVPTATPQATTEASATPVTTTTPETSTPTATPLATATAKPTSTATPIPTPSPKPTETPKPPDTNNGEAAAALFKQSCTSCHGVDLEGDFGPNLQKIGSTLTKAQIAAQITNGGDAMPSFKKSLKAEEIQTLATWLAAKK